METIDNVAVIQLIRAQQIRRNEAAKNERNRNYARDIFVRYFSKFSKRKEHNEPMVAERL